MGENVVYLAIAVPLVILGGVAVGLARRWIREEAERHASAKKKWEASALPKPVAGRPQPRPTRRRIREDAERHTSARRRREVSALPKLVAERAQPLPTRRLAPLPEEPAEASPVDRTPLKIPPLRTAGRIHLSEMMVEPAASVNSGVVDVWAYGDQRAPHAIVIAGHADGTVCRQASSLVANTIINLPVEMTPLSQPGVGFLESEAAVSELVLSPKSGKKAGARPKTVQLGTNMTTLPEELEKMARDSGMVRVHRLPEQGTARWQEALITPIGAHYDADQDRLLRWSTGLPEGNSVAFFAPYYRLGDPHLTPLSFYLPLSLIECDEFLRVRDYHRRAYYLEMAAEARRRKYVYEEWLRQDQRNLVIAEARYEQMTPAQRQIRDIPIEWIRDPLTLEVRRAKEPELINQHELVHVNLPLNIRSDEFWIKKMDEIIDQVEGRRKRGDARQEAVNVGSLIDSFLRGWSSVFLVDKEAKKAYNAWCKKKRKLAWRAIRDELAAIGVRIEPLLERDTTFKVELVGKRLRITPLHLLDAGQTQYVLLSSGYGIPWYVNTWQRRKRVSAPKVGATTGPHPNEAEALRLAQLAADQVNQGDYETGLDTFRLALAYHPPAAANFIYRKWWQNFGRDTTDDFELLSLGVRGFRTFREGHLDQARRAFAEFVKKKPNYFAEAHLILALLPHYRTPEVSRLVKRRRELIDTFNEKVRERKPTADLLESKKSTIDRLLREHGEPDISFDFPGLGAGRGDLADVLAQLRSGRSRPPGSYRVDLSGMTSEERLEFRQIQKAQEKLRSMQSSLERMKEQIERLDAQLAQAERSILARIKESHDPHIEVARRLDPEWVDALATNKIPLLANPPEASKKPRQSAPRRWSQSYIARILPVMAILQGLECLDIAQKLFEVTLKIQDNRISRKGILDVIASVIEPIHIESDKMYVLRNFQERLRETQATDILIRNLVWRKELEQISQDFLSSAKTYIDNVVSGGRSRLPLLIEPFKIQSYLLPKFRLQYQAALRELHAAKITLRNFSPTGEFEVLDDSDFTPKDLHLDEAQRAIYAIKDDGQEVALLRCSGLKDEEQRHLTACLADPNFKPAHWGPSAAERLLDAVIDPAPAAVRWRRVLTDLQPWLLRTLAFFGITPWADFRPTPEKLLDLLEEEDREIRLTPEVDKERIIEEFRHEHAPQAAICDVVSEADVPAGSPG